jgi:hypothetical protein
MIPQCALWIAPDEGGWPVFVMQAECNLLDPEGEALFGLQTIEGERFIASEGDVYLLGPSWL